MNSNISVKINNYKSIFFRFEKKPGIDFLDSLNKREFKTRDRLNVTSFLTRFLDEFKSEEKKRLFCPGEYETISKIRDDLVQEKEIEYFSFYIG